MKGERWRLSQVAEIGEEISRATKERKETEIRVTGTERRKPRD